ncbi:unnamed protein product [Schistosoma rodhaini]|uniref:Uncharacterized protein n=1 Tax=Schistosoma rodhaini TaxID=6188 RepID=A0AA85G398_9TREM|nr:unnamed protein product [Schistosoma rodhaini]
MCNWYNHRIFNLRCLNHHVYPRTLPVKTPDNSPRSQKAAVTATRVFLRECIHKSTKNLESLRSRIANIDSVLSLIIPTEIKTNVVEFFEHEENFYDQITKKSQIRKFEKLFKHPSKFNNYAIRNNSKELDINKIVVNLSDKHLNQHELSLLEKGLNFNLSKTQLMASEIIPIIEPALNNVPTDQANSVRFRISNALLKQKPNTHNLFKEEMYALKQLRKDRKIVIMRADKGNITVVMNNSDYEKKVNEHLHTGPY